MYHDLRGITGYNIGYFAVDSRLFPFSATSQNIFYQYTTVSLEHTYVLRPDLVVLSAGMVPAIDVERIAQVLDIDLDEDGFIEILDRKNRATETTGANGGAALEMLPASSATLTVTPPVGFGLLTKTTRSPGCLPGPV